MTRCVWCANPHADDADVTDADRQLCRAHLAEYEGLTEAELDRADAEEWADQH